MKPEIQEMTRLHSEFSGLRLQVVRDGRVIREVMACSNPDSADTMVDMAKRYFCTLMPRARVEDRRS